MEIWEVTILVVLGVGLHLLCTLVNCYSYIGNAILFITLFTVKYTVVAKIIRNPDISENIENINFKMLLKHADGCSEHNKYQMKWVVLFLSF